MLTKDYRLRSNRDINRVYARGRFGAASGLAVKALANHLSLSRATIVVGRKVSKKAVVRNRIRRRLSAQLADLWQTVTGGYDIVVTVREDISALPVPELQHRLVTALTRSGVIATKKP